MLVVLNFVVVQPRDVGDMAMVTKGRKRTAETDFTASVVNMVVVGKHFIFLLIVA